MNPIVPIWLAWALNLGGIRRGSTNGQPYINRNMPNEFFGSAPLTDGPIPVNKSIDMNTTQLMTWLKSNWYLLVIAYFIWTKKGRIF